MKRARIIVSFMIIALTAAHGQEPLRHSEMLRSDAPPRYFTGSARVDLFCPSALKGEGSPFREALIDSADTLAVLEHPGHKSPWLAGVLSLAVPGSGELYSESYVKGGIFIALEAAAWIVSYTYDKKGDRQTDMFQGFADDHWSVVQYATWMNANRSANIAVNPNANLPPWERVVWDVLNYYERLADSVRPSGGFTHALPPHGEQQYYELIGKYPQYSPGWDDYAGAVEANGVPVPSRNFLDYSAMRGKANDYYSIASSAFSVIIANHVISALDAFFTASRFNKSFHAGASMKLRQTPFGPVAEKVVSVTVNF